MLTTESPHGELAAAALSHLLANTSMPVLVLGDRKPVNFPLPTKRAAPAAPGADTVQEYRPLAILEYVHSLVSAAAKTPSASTEAEHAQECR
ncbi:hypothetical protein V8Z74_19460 [Comamonas sp. w2-DMI]|uniref:hypothetical protein n=1 Tax=Comamonas sp. w2-DMI TaxID=3126391 RepID=UPI0032E4BC6B